jgi:hypothetical protein
MNRGRSDERVLGGVGPVRVTVGVDAEQVQEEHAARFMQLPARELELRAHRVLEWVVTWSFRVRFLCDDAKSSSTRSNTHVSKFDASGSQLIVKIKASRRAM